MNIKISFKELENRIYLAVSEKPPNPTNEIVKIIKNIIYTEIKQNDISKNDEFKDLMVKTNYQMYFSKILSLYNNQNFSLKKYSQEGFKLWYLDIITKWFKPTKIDQLRILTGKDYLEPIKFSRNNYETQKFYKKELKNQVNLKTTILAFRIKNSTFDNIIEKIKKNNVSDFLIWHNRNLSRDRNLSLPVYHSAISGDLHICSCSVDIHSESGGLPIGAKITDGICHLCIAKNASIDELQKRYGTDYLFSKHSFIRVIEKLQKCDFRTARAEVDRIFNTTKWKSEGLLYSLIKNIFSTYTIIREYSPEWLKPMRIDIFILEINLAIEYQGKQHFEPIEIFGGEKSYINLIKRDKIKKDLCLVNNINLIYFSYKESVSFDNVIKKLSNYI